MGVEIWGGGGLLTFCCKKSIKENEGKQATLSHKNTK